MLARWAENAVRDAETWERHGDTSLARLARLRAEIYISAAELVDADGMPAVVGPFRHHAATLAAELDGLERLGAPLQARELLYIAGRAHQAVAAAISGELIEYIHKWP
ncbi:hypothetical protein [Longimycelium tulufanense]|nr:hypothetical protein [Longimycelium tulufanense]